MWLDLEMTGLDVERHVIVEIAALVTDDDLEPVDDGIDLIVHQPASALAEMDDFVRTMHTKSALLPEIEASTLYARRRRRAGARVRARPRRRGQLAAVRQLDRRRPALPRPPAPRARPATCTTAASTCRASRSSAAAGTPSVYKGRPGKTETHRALADVQESIAELRYYREHMLAAPAPATPRRPTAERLAQELAQRAEQRRDRPVARAEWPMSPMRQALPGELAEPAADLDAVGARAAPCAAWRRRRRRAATRS